jgi:hypothetical protein
MNEFARPTPLKDETKDVLDIIVVSRRVSIASESHSPRRREVKNHQLALRGLEQGVVFG